MNIIIFSLSVSEVCRCNGDDNDRFGTVAAKADIDTIRIPLFSVYFIRRADYY